MNTRSLAKDRIASNIRTHGYHLYLVTGGEIPRFAYTIGLSEGPAGAELMLAGGTVFLADQVESILAQAARHIQLAGRPRDSFEVADLGGFSLRETDDDWVGALALGAVDYYRGRSVRMLQIVPDADHWTIDVPNMQRPIHDDDTSPWQWVRRPWTFAVPRDATATTHLEALKGSPIIEAARWESDEWELFAGPGAEVDRADIRIVPIGTLLAHDPTLLPALDLEVGTAIRRDSAQGAWRAWR